MREPKQRRSAEVGELETEGRQLPKADVLRRLELTKDMVRKALPRLSATAEIETIDGKHTVVDPLFAEWIERLNQGLPDPDTLDDAAPETTETGG